MHDPSTDTANAIPPRPAPRPPLRFGTLMLESRFLLSPLAGYTNLPFRLVIRELGGVGLCTTDLVNARGLLAQTPKTCELTETCPGDEPLAVQIFGHEPQVMADAARLLERRGAAAVDINMGCPVDKVTRCGAGASMMVRPDDTARLVETVVRAVKIPVTVKMRLGWDDASITAPRLARRFESAGVAAVAIHGRTRAQGFSGTVNREGIRSVVEAVRTIPVIGNGDVRTVADAARMLEETGCAGVSIGRGALANPWIFRQLAAWEATGSWPPAGSFDERLALFRRQLELRIAQLGPERAIPSIRPTAHWHLKAMRVPAALRNRYQQARTPAEAARVLAEIEEHGPQGASRTSTLPDLAIPVPRGPVEHW